MYQSNSFWPPLVCCYPCGRKLSQVKHIIWLQNYHKDPMSSLQAWAGVRCVIWRIKVHILKLFFFAFLHTFWKILFSFCTRNICKTTIFSSLKTKFLFSVQFSRLSYLKVFHPFSQNWCFDNKAQLMGAKDKICSSHSSRNGRTWNSSEQILWPSEELLFKFPFQDRDGLSNNIN